MRGRTRRREKGREIENERQIKKKRKGKRERERDFSLRGMDRIKMLLTMLLSWEGGREARKKKPRDVG